MIIVFQTMKLYGSCDIMKMQNTTMTFRLPQEIKNKFMDVAKNNNMQTAFVLRQLIINYIKTDGKGVSLC